MQTELVIYDHAENGLSLFLIPETDADRGLAGGMNVTTDLDHFREHLREHPDDCDTRLVYADWCEENGDHERRLAQALAKLGIQAEGS